MGNPSNTMMVYLFSYSVLMLDAVKLTPIQAVDEVLRYALVDVASK
jgi:hypothetical protein